MSEASSTHFGFSAVTPEEKTAKVRGVFNQVASRYDLMNDAMSGGLHRLWKDAFVTEARIRPDMQCLDVAGGTGDIAFRILKKGAAHVTVCDINAAMLGEGQARACNRNQLQGLDWICGNAESLPFASNRFHLYTIAFGIRNVTHITKALAEAHRVLRPGGRFMCLEFSQVNQPMLAKFYDAYSFHVIPKLGRLLAGDDAPYQYLVESIRKFPRQEAFVSMLTEAGFSQARYRNFAGGAVAMHSGYKL